MSSSCRISVSLLVLIIGVTLAFPQQQQQNNVQQQQSAQFTQNNGYLPQISSLLQGQGQQQGSFIPSDNQAHFAGAGGGGDHSIGLVPPPVANHPLSGELQSRAALQQEQQGSGAEQDTYSNFQQYQQQAGNLASSLRGNTGNGHNPHEYGETVPGEFSSLNSYAAYQNYQPNSN